MCNKMCRMITWNKTAQTVAARTVQEGRAERNIDILFKVTSVPMENVHNKHMGPMI